MWPYVNADQYHTRHLDISGRSIGEGLTIFYDDETYEVNDVVVDGDFIYLSMLGYLDCINKDGSRKWRAEYPYSETTVVQIIAVTENGIFTHHGGSIYRHDLTGEEEWAFTVPGTMDGGISSANYDTETRCIFCCMNGENNYLVCISDEGGEVWRKEVDYSASGIIVAEYCYVCCGSSIISINKTDGITVDVFSLLVSGSAFVGAKLLCCIDESLFVFRYLYDLQTYDVIVSIICLSKNGNILWEKELPGGAWSHTLMDHIFLSSESAILEVDSGMLGITYTDEFKYIVSENDKLYCLNDNKLSLYDTSLNEIDTYTFEHYGYARSIALDDYVYVAHGNVLYRLDAYYDKSKPPPEPKGISYELIIGPVTFGLPYLEKRVRKAVLAVSKEASATMLVATSASDIGDFTEDIPVGVGQELDMQEVRIPMAQGDPSGGLAYRVRIKGSGVVQVHDISFEVSARRI